MAKPHRGSSLRELFKHGRGECPVCKRKNIKVLYEQETDGQKFKICKTCKAAIKNGTKSLPVVAKAPSQEPKEKPAKAEEAVSAEVASSEAASSKAVETETAAEKD